MHSFTACRSSQHCAVHGFCHRCAPHLADAGRHVVQALSSAGIADADQGRAYAEIVAILLGAAPVCGDQLVDWTCALPAGPHPAWKHAGDGAWWTQTRCPADCGQPNTTHDCTKEISS